MDVDIDSISYSELQKLAKKFGIKANKKAIQLRSELRKFIIVDNFEDTNTQLKHFHSPEGNKLCISSSGFVDGVANTENFTSTPEDKTDVLNTTYELEHSVLCPTIACSENVQSTPVSSDLPKSDLKPNVTANAHKKRPAIRAVPNFSRIHAKAASKLESLVSYASRRNLLNNSSNKRTERGSRPPFASPRYVSNCTSSTKPLGLSNKVNKPIQNGLLSNSRNTRPIQSISPTKRAKANVFSVKDSKSLNMSSKALVIRKTTIIPADSAFARRKAYDLKQSLARPLPYTPHRGSLKSDYKISKNLSADESHQKIYSPWKSWKSLRQDIKTQKFMKPDRQKVLDTCQSNRLNARQTEINKRRGLC